MVLDPQSIDINGDGLDDLVLHFQSSAASVTGNGASGQHLGNIAPPDRLVILIKQANGTFVDKTDVFVTGSVKLEGFAGVSRVIDINGDGKLDVVYAVNREDGRSQDIPSDMFAQNAVLLSNSNGTYSVKKFGQNDWNGSVAVGNINNTPFITGVGFITNVSNSYVADSSNNLVVGNLKIPSISANAVEFSTAIDATYLVQTGEWPNIFGLDAYKITKDGWIQLKGISSSYKEVGTAPWVNYTNTTSSSVPIINVNGKYAVGPGGGTAIDKSCQLKMTPTSATINIFSASMMYLPRYVLGQTTTVSQADTVGGASLQAARIVNDAIELVPLNIDKEQNYNVNVGGIACMDVNGDGYDDIVVYSYEVGGKPFVYLNNKSNGFTYADSSKFPSAPTNWGNAARSYLHKFSKTGGVDLLILPSNGINVVSGDTVFKYYKAIKPLI
jgi:hypothetical protein